MATMTIDTLAVVAMFGLFAVFLGAMWWEARRVLSELADQERAAICVESEQAFRREMAREQARYRLNRIRVENKIEHALEESGAMGPEHIGRILERLAQVETSVEPEWERVPELNFVRGGQAEAAPVVKTATRKSGKKRVAQSEALPFVPAIEATSGPARRRAQENAPLLAGAMR